MAGGDNNAELLLLEDILRRLQRVEERQGEQDEKFGQVPSVASATASNTAEQFMKGATMSWQQVIKMEVQKESIYNRIHRRVTAGVIAFVLKDPVVAGLSPLFAALIP